MRLISIPCSTLCLCVEVAILVEAGFCSIMSEPPVRRRVNSTIVILPNLTLNLLQLAMRGSYSLDLPLQTYRYETVGTGVPTFSGGTLDIRYIFHGIAYAKLTSLAISYKKKSSLFEFGFTLGVLLDKLEKLGCILELKHTTHTWPSVSMPHVFGQGLALSRPKN